MALGRTIEDRVREERQVRDAYGMAFFFVLIATLAIVAAGTPLVSPLAAGAGLLQLGALLLTLRVSGFTHKTSTMGSALGTVAVIATIAAVAFAADSARLPGLAVWLLLTLTTIAAIARRLVTYRQVNLQMVMGLLIIYMLVGMTFALGYQVVDAIAAPALTPSPQGLSGAIYFSFVTLATLGYGDVVPGDNVVRAMAIAEALVGQLYLVSVVSLAVSRLGSPRQARGNAGDVNETHES